MATKKQAGAANGATVQISAPDFRTAEYKIVGTAPYVQLKFSQKAIDMMSEKMKAGSQGKKGSKKTARNFEEDYHQALHVSEEGWYGIPAGAFRNALISACRIVGFQMTKAKLSVFVESDGIDPSEGTPLVRIYGEPEMVVHHVRNATGVADLRVRGMWREWHAIVRVRFDHDMFSITDITNLLARVGMQVGIGEGRPDGKQSAGMGWGTFAIGGDQ